MKHIIITSSIIVLSAVSVYGYSVEIDDSEVILGMTTLPGLGEYDYVTIPGGAELPAEPGSPALPGYSVMLALPIGTAIEAVEVTYAEPVVIDGVYNIIPAQEPQKIGEKPSHYIPPDDIVYASSAPFPGEIVQGFNSGNMSGYHAGNILFAPVQYTPATGELIIYRSIDFDVVLSGTTDSVYPNIRLRWIDGRIRESLLANVINPSEVPLSSSARLIDEVDGYKTGTYGYLIIVPVGWEDEVALLSEWKMKKGIPVAVVTNYEILTGYTGVDFPEKVRNCIKDYYQNEGTVYVCLVGDKSDIPMREAYDPSYYVGEGDHLVPTDNYYGCLDGSWNDDGDTYWGEHDTDDLDYYYDVYVGRLQVNEPEDLPIMIEKILTYEGTELAATANPYDYLDHVCLGGAWLDESTNMALEMQFIDDEYLIGGFWDVRELYDDYYGGTSFNKTAFIDRMNEGMNLIAHSAHSGTAALGTNSGTVFSNHLTALNNAPRFTGSFYSLGCYQANFDNGFNCAACYVRAPNGGGVGYVGNTRYGFYLPGIPLHCRSALFQEEYYNQLGVSDVYIGGMTNAAHKHALNSYMQEDLYRYINFELYHTGDPELWIHTDMTGTLDVSYQDEIAYISQSYDVHVASAKAPVADALVCLWKGIEVYASGVTDGNGDIIFDIAPTTIGTMFLTVSAHNYRTFEADVLVKEEVGIDLVSFEGNRIKDGVLLNWEVNDAEGCGFNLYRRPLAAGLSDKSSTNSRTAASVWVKINDDPIIGENPYSYTDTTADAIDYEYRLEAVVDAGNEEVGTTTVSGDLPFAFALNQSRPNPSNGSAIIAFSIPRTVDVTLEIFDIKGRKVATLVDENLPEGEYERTVSGLASGIYLYRLTAGDNVATMKMAVK